MEIEHLFKGKAHDVKALFNKTNKVSTFMNKLSKQSILDPNKYDSDKYVGDGFEMLIEILIKSHAYDNRFGLTDYHPIQVNDNGVDGVGFNISGEKSVVQIKYRSKVDSVLTASGDKLDSMVTEAQLTHDVILEKKNSVKRHYIFTTAKDLHHYTNNVKFQNTIKCIGYDDLRSLLDNNVSFWNLCRKLVN